MQRSACSRPSARFRSSTPASLELSRDFHRAFEMRQKSDYRVAEPATSERAAELLTRAERFVAALREHLQNHRFSAE